jgi:hypothetical protein
VHATLAASLATEIDRLALCIHRPTSRRPELVAALGSLGLPRQSIAVVAARFLAAGRLSHADLRSMSRYQSDADMRTMIDAHVRRGVLEAVDGEADTFTPTPALAAGAQVVLDLQAEEADRLWSATAGLASIGAVARAHVDAALESDVPLDAFRRQVGVHHAIPASDAGQLLGSITELRYLRSDVHASCLLDEGLSGPSARALHRLWRGFDAGGAIDASLLDAGLVEVRAEQPRPTARGIAACVRVEDATDARFAAIFGSLPGDVSTELLDGLRSLSGEDPRPVEDR